MSGRALADAGFSGDVDLVVDAKASHDASALFGGEDRGWFAALRARLSLGGGGGYNGRGSLGPSMAERVDGGATGASGLRWRMVESQVRPNQVNDRRVLEAMRQMPREAFAPAGALAYSDADLPLGEGRFMLAPMLIGRLVQLVMMETPARVLVIGANAGYGAALLAGCGAEVTALEEDRRFGGATLAEVAPTVHRVYGALLKGWPNGGPYDAIFIEGAVPAIPAGLARQLAAGGRVITILADGLAPGGIGRAVIAEPAPGGFAAAPMFDCTARILPAFQPAPAFSF